MFCPNHKTTLQVQSHTCFEMKVPKFNCVTPLRAPVVQILKIIIRYYNTSRLIRILYYKSEKLKWLIAKGNHIGTNM